jgi:hypothetical protein
MPSGKQLPTSTSLQSQALGPNGAAYSFKATYPKQGGTPIGAQGLSSVLTVIGPGNVCFTSLQNGKQVAVSHVVVSRDGKTAQETSKRIDAQGKMTEQLPSACKEAGIP